MPVMSPDEHDALVLDIEAAHTVEVPLDILADGTILDGRHRWQAASTLGIERLPVRVIDPPDPVAYMVRMAVVRRHLTKAQKQALNARLRTVVTEVVEHPTTGEEVRIGMGQTQRAKVLGVDRETVKRWDRTDGPDGANAPSGAGPTHQRIPDVRGRERIEPISKPPEPPKEPAPSRTTKPEPKGRIGSGPRRPPPRWRRHFTLWCRRALPEDRRLLLEMDAELHDALRAIGMDDGSER